MTNIIDGGDLPEDAQFDELMLANKKGDTVSYFSQDGNYGGINGEQALLIVNTSLFTEEDWDSISSCSDNTRYIEARSITERTNSRGLLVTIIDKPEPAE
jgi:hypothetical protein